MNETLEQKLGPILNIPDFAYGERWVIPFIFVPAMFIAAFFVLLPRRWVVERTFAWLGRCRRLANDWEKSIESATAWTTIAHIRRLTRLIASHCQIV